MATKRSTRERSGLPGHVVDDEDIPEGEKLLTSHGIKLRLHIHQKTAERMLRGGQIPGAFKWGRRWYVRKQDFLRHAFWLSTRENDQ